MIKETSNTLLIENLSPISTEPGLRFYFESYGIVECVEIIRDEKGQSKGYGYIKYKDPEDAFLAIERLNETTFDNRIISVRLFLPNLPTNQQESEQPISKSDNPTPSKHHSKKSHTHHSRHRYSKAEGYCRVSDFDHDNRNNATTKPPIPSESGQEYYYANIDSPNFEQTSFLETPDENDEKPPFGSYYSRHPEDLKADNHFAGSNYYGEFDREQNHRPNPVISQSNDNRLLYSSVDTKKKSSKKDKKKDKNSKHRKSSKNRKRRHQSSSSEDYSSYSYSYSYSYSDSEDHPKRT